MRTRIFFAIGDKCSDKGGPTDWLRVAPPDHGPGVLPGVERRGSRSTLIGCSASGGTGEIRLNDYAFAGTWVELVDIMPVG